MKYIITGAAGNISRPLSEKLLKAGHEVTVISRNRDHLKPLTDLGARPAIGSVRDPDFLKDVFTGADAVYSMVPPSYDAADLKSSIAAVVKNYAEAIQTCGIKYVVNLSSIGAHLSEGCGPVTGLYRGEHLLNALPGVNLRHLRPGYFFANLLGNVGMIKNMNIMGANFGGPGFKLVLADTNDIAAAAFEELTLLKFTGSSVRYIASDERGTDEIAKVLGTAIGKPSVPWITFTDDQALGGMLQMGFPEEAAKNFVEMGHSFQSGSGFADYWKHRPAELGKTKLEDFAKVFNAVFNQN